MAFQISTLFSHIRTLTSTGRLSCSSIDFQTVGVKFKHILSSAETLAKRPLVRVGRNLPAGCNKASILPSHINPANQVEKFSTTVSKSREKRGLLRRVTLGALGALGVTATAVVCFHTSARVTMAAGPENIKVNLNSAEGDWKETKDWLLSVSVEERRQYYRTPNYESLDNIPVWTPTSEADGCEQPCYPRNEKMDRKISLYSGDITKLEIDAIVNAANKTLLGGGGVDGAIHRAAGPKLKKECASLQGCETGQAKITCGYGLPAKYVIHTVGPIAMAGVGEEERRGLRACYRNSLETATAPENGVRSLAFPCISTGIYGYPPEQAVHEALSTVREYLDEHHDKLDRVIFCVFLPTDKELYLKNLPLYFPGASTEARVKSKL